MTSLQTVVMGLVIVFLDIPPDGYDWIADPVGWVLVLLGLAALDSHLPNRRGLVATAWACLAFAVVSWPEGSPATLTPVLGWLFSLPTLAWCFLVCDAVSEAVEGRLRWVLLGLRNLFLVVAPLPGLVYLGGQDWLSTPAEVLILVANLGLLLALGSASGRPGLDDPEAESEPGTTSRNRSRADDTARDTSRPSTPAVPPAPASRPRPKTVGFSAAEAKRRARARRDKESPKSPKSPPKPAQKAEPPTPARGAGASQPSSATRGGPEADRRAGAPSGAADTPSAKAPDGGPVTGAEVIEKVRRRRAAREKAQERDAPDA